LQIPVSIRSGVNMALRIFVLAATIPWVCLAQSAALKLSSGTASPGTSVTLALTLDATGASPASAQWALEYAAADFSAVTVTAGPAVTKSGKQIACNQTTGATTCMLWGMDAKPIENGVIARVTVTLSPSSFANSSGVQVVNCLAADAAGDAVLVSGQGGGVSLPQVITASPNPIPLASALIAETMISWDAPDSPIVEVRIGSPTGTLFASGGSSGTAKTGDWVANGMVFVLVDATTNNVLGATTVLVTPPSPPTIAAVSKLVTNTAGVGVGQAAVTWNAPGYSGVEVHVGSATGTLFASGGTTGSSETGNWVSDGMVFVLVDPVTHAVLATTVAQLPQ
jgi:hypothetical protein